MPRPAPSRVAAALDYLERLKNQAAEFGGGVVENLADRARSVGGLAYEALATDPNMGRMTTAEFSEAASRPTPRLDQAAQDLGTIGRAIVTQPIQTGKAIVQGEIDRAQEATTSPRAAGEYAGSFIDPMRIAAALRRTAPVLELDVYHGTPHRFPATEANPLGEFDASKIGTGEGEQAYGHGVYLAEAPKVAKGYQKSLAGSSYIDSATQTQKRSGDLWTEARNAVLNAGQPHPDRAGQIASQVQDWVDSGRSAKTFLKHRAVPKSLEPAYQVAMDAFGGAKKNTGALYKADLPDEMIDRMLEWEKPLSEQSEFVKAAIRAMPDAPDESKWKNWTGEYLYRIHLQRGGRESPEKSLKVTASEKLQNASIPGIKYFDAGSRNRGLSATGTRNFVVFPGEEKKVRILERDGQKAPPQKIAQALEAAPDYRMGHRPMTVEGGAARLDNAYEAFGEDIYGPNALRYFGGSDPRESGTVAALKRLRDNPDAEVTIYRGVPTDAKSGITKGDWVTLDKSVAQEYTELKPGQKGKVLAMKVKAKDVTTWPDSLLEFGYYPAD